ncbi:MAG TPA: FxLYD domain-containing protein, partial [Acidobacteriota bacterium]|nr:FxLYD domain-containing protein [Acidobacteriota bacterium]
MNSLVDYSKILPIVLIAIGAVGISFFLLTSFIRFKRKKARKTGRLKNNAAAATEGSAPEPEFDKNIVVATSSPPPAFSVIGRPSGVLADFFRAFLIALTLVVAAGFTLILLPAHSVEKITQSLQSRSALSGQEMIALLYLGDDATESSFRIRGVIRNITTSPVERLDATVRLYNADGRLIETVVVRTDRDTIAPDEIAYLDLYYPDFPKEFSRYEVEFKLREGTTV